MNTPQISHKLTKSVYYFLIVIICQIVLINTASALNLRLDNGKSGIATQQLELEEVLKYIYSPDGDSVLQKSIITNSKHAFPFVCLGPNVTAIPLDPEPLIHFDAAEFSRINGELILDYGDMYKIYGDVGIASVVYTYTNNENIVDLTTDSVSQCVTKGFTPVEKEDFMFADSFEDIVVAKGVVDNPDIKLKIVKEDGSEFDLENIRKLANNELFKYKYIIENVGNTDLDVDMVDYYSRDTNFPYLKDKDSDGNTNTWSCNSSTTPSISTNCGYTVTDNPNDPQNPTVEVIEGGKGSVYITNAVIGAGEFLTIDVARKAKVTTVTPESRIDLLATALIIYNKAANPRYVDSNLIDNSLIVPLRVRKNSSPDATGLPSGVNSKIIYEDLTGNPALTNSFDFTVSDALNGNESTDQDYDAMYETVPKDLTVTWVPAENPLIESVSILPIEPTDGNRTITVTPFANDFTRIDTLDGSSILVEGTDSPKSITLAISDGADVTEETFDLTILAVNDEPFFEAYDFLVYDAVFGQLDYLGDTDPTSGQANKDTPVVNAQDNVVKIDSIFKGFKIDNSDLNEPNKKIEIEPEQDYEFNVSVVEADANKPIFATNTEAGVEKPQVYISKEGVLTYIFSDNAKQGGRATITITMKDDGGTLYGGVDSFSEDLTLITRGPSMTVEKSIYFGADTGASCLIATPITSLQAIEGETVTYCYKITNTGVTYLNVNNFSDAAVSQQLADLSVLGVGSLNIPPVSSNLDNFINLYVEHTVLANDSIEKAVFDAEPVKDAANTSYNPVIGNITSESNEVTLDVVNPMVELTKVVYQGQDGGVGCAAAITADSPTTVSYKSRVTYCYEINNTGDVDLKLNLFFDSFNATPIPEIFDIASLDYLQGLSDVNLIDPPETVLEPGKKAVYYYERTASEKSAAGIRMDPILSPFIPNLQYIEADDNAKETFQVEVSIAATTQAVEDVTNGQFTISIDEALNDPLTVYLGLSGSATNGTDMSTMATSVEIPAGDTSMTADVTLVSDTIAEGDETVTLTLDTNSGPINGVVASNNASNSATVTISDNDTAVEVSIEATTQAVEDMTNGLFTISVDKTLSKALTVNLGLSGSATNGTDMSTMATSVVIPAGDTSVTADVTLVSDTIAEGDETVTLTLGAASGHPSGVVVSYNASDSATVTITDNDTASIIITASNIMEGDDTETTDLEYTVTLTGSVENSFTVPYSITGGTATSGTDFAVLPDGVVTFPQGSTTNDSQTITVTVNGEVEIESDETIIMSLSQAGQNNIVFLDSNDARATGEILNDESTISIDNPSVAEGGSGTTTILNYTVTLAGDIQDELTIDFASSDGTATLADSDYVATSDVIAGSKIIFPAGSTSGTPVAIPVTVNGDNDDAEGNETIIITLSDISSSNVTFANNVGTGTISEATISISNPIIGEVGDLTFDVILTGDYTSEFYVPYTVAGSAMSPSDYDNSLLTGVFYFPANSPSGTVKSVDVQTINDGDVEEDETVVINLLAPTSDMQGMNLIPEVTFAKEGDKVGTGVIENNDFGGVLVSNATVQENGMLSIDFTLNKPVPSGFSFEISTADTLTNIATPGIDYIQITNKLLEFDDTFPQSKSITFMPIDDNILDAGETVKLLFNSVLPTNPFPISLIRQTGTNPDTFEVIQNNANPVIITINDHDQ